MYGTEDEESCLQGAKFEFRLCIVNAFPDLFELLYLLHSSNFEADFFEDSKAILNAM